MSRTAAAPRDQRLLEAARALFEKRSTLTRAAHELRAENARRVAAARLYGSKALPVVATAALDPATTAEVFAGPVAEPHVRVTNAPEFSSDEHPIGNKT